MFSNIFQNNEVREELKKICSRTCYQEKDIPITISEEKLDIVNYSLFMFIDALIKYYIIVDDDLYISNYLEQIDKLLKKIENHNDIKLGINKLLINFCATKLELENITSEENKKIIFKYIYDKYIENGYVFHSFPSKFLEDVKTNGLSINNYNMDKEKLLEIDSIFKKYGVDDVFSKDLDENPYISITDSPFLGAYYAYYSPQFMNDFITFFYDNSKNYDTSVFFKKDFERSRKNLVYFMNKIGLLRKDMNKVLSFFEDEWEHLDIDNRSPIMCLIKRKDLSLDLSHEYLNLVNELSDSDLSVVITKLLDTRLNNFKEENNISSDKLIFLPLPTIEDLGLKDTHEQIKKENKSNEFIDEYGNTTIIALVGVLLITLGLTIMTILIGR